MLCLEYKDLVPSSKESLRDMVDALSTSDDRFSTKISSLEYWALMKLFKRNASKLHEKHRFGKSMGV